MQLFEISLFLEFVTPQISSLICQSKKPFKCLSKILCSQCLYFQDTVIIVSSLNVELHVSISLHFMQIFDSSFCLFAEYINFVFHCMPKTVHIILSMQPDTSQCVSISLYSNNGYCASLQIYSHSSFFIDSKIFPCVSYLDLNGSFLV